VKRQAAAQPQSFDHESFSLGGASCLDLSVIVITFMAETAERPHKNLRHKAVEQKPLQRISVDPPCDDTTP